MNILILCTGNSCRSQMAEVFARQFFPKNANIYSAGIEKHGLNPYMLKVMRETGRDLTGLSSKTIPELPALEWDIVLTVCPHAAENCPYLPAKKQLHIPFPDPPSLAKGLVNEAEILAIYRSVRDEIRDALSQLSLEL